MIEHEPFEMSSVMERSLLRGVVLSAADDHHFVVLARHGGDEWVVFADLVVTSATPLRLRVGDNVLCVLDTEDPERGFILGRIGPSTPVGEPETTTTATREHPPLRASTALVDAPDSLVIEAKHSLTLRVGDGSITIREDGKILIKGRDLVSHAQRTNRIKGGAVAIN